MTKGLFFETTSQLANAAHSKCYRQSGNDGDSDHHLQQQQHQHHHQHHQQPTTNNNQQQPTTANNNVTLTPDLLNNINKVLEEYNIDIVSANVVEPHSIIDDYNAFIQGNITGVNLIQISILNAISEAEEGLILNTAAMKQLETAYQLAGSNNVPRKKG